MKISLNWIGEYVDLSGYTPEALMDLLTLHTTEVEGLELFADGIQDVLVGEVLSCGSHPDADKLSVTEVAYGGSEPIQVVCGAPNVRKGLKIAFAPLGATLPGGLEIKEAKLRGVASVGMICSERELELGDSHAGIMELPADAPVGARLVDYLDLLDSVLEVDNKAINHRPDLWGHYGFAREFAAILKRPLTPLPLFQDWPDQPTPVSVSVADEAACPFYSVASFAGIAGAATSSLSIQRRLLAVGQRPVNLVVDLTNYVLLETGQPTHAFDCKKISKGQLDVRMAKAGETLVTLDEETRSLSPQDLLITDASAPVALAGVMGGQETQVDASTEQILLESASFAATQIRRTSHRLGLRSESSARFEKTLDLTWPLLAQGRFAHLLLEHCAEATVTGSPVTVGCSQPEEVQLTLEVSRVAKRLGLALSPEEMAQTLERLGFEVTVQEASLQVKVPTWRSSKDVRLPVDLEEEVGRMVGYDQIQPQPLIAPLEPASLSPEQLLARRFATCLMGSHRAYQTQGYSFLSSEALQKQELSMDGYVSVQNPVHAGADLLRKDPLLSLCEQAVANERETASGILFEIGKGYSEPLDSACEPQERHWLGLVSWKQSALGGGGKHGEETFRHARGVVEDLLHKSGKEVHLAAGRMDLLSPLGNPSRVLTWTCVASAEPVAQVFQIHPALREALGFTAQEVSLVLLDIPRLSRASDSPFAFQAPAKFPAIKADVSLALPKGVTFAETEAALRKAAGKNLSHLLLFDHFEGEGLPEGFKSLAFRATLRSSEKTLSEKDEKRYLKVAARVAEELGGHLRS